MTDFRASIIGPAVLIAYLDHSPWTGIGATYITLSPESCYQYLLMALWMFWTIFISMSVRIHFTVVCSLLRPVHCRREM